MKLPVFKRCTKCPAQARYRKGDKRCPKCGSDRFTWAFVADVGKAHDGRRQQVKRGGFLTREAAERALRELLAAVDERRYVERSTVTLGQFLRREWMPATKRTVAETTWDRRRNYIESYITAPLEEGGKAFGDVPLQELSPPQLNAFYAELQEKGRRRGHAPLAQKTVREAHVLLHKALKDAARWGYLDRNPADLADPPSASAVAQARKAAIRTWTAEQVQTFAAHINKHPFYPVWLVAVMTGLRRSELLGLRWEDVDLEHSRLSVRQVLVVVDGEPRLKPAPKSRHGYRTVDLDATTLEVLRRHRVEWLQRKFGAGPA